MWRIFAASLLIFFPHGSLQSCDVQRPERQGFEKTHPAEASLREQVEAVLTAIKNGNEQQVRDLFGTFRLPDPGTFFSQHFGQESAAILTPRYEKLASAFLSAAEKTWSDLVRYEHYILKIELKEGEPKLSRPSAGFRPDAYVPREELTFCRFGFEVRVGDYPPISWQDTFVHTEGAFRFVGGGAYPFWAWERDRGRMAGLLIPAKVISTTKPVYPAKARTLKIEGIVELRLTVTREGTVKDVKVVFGDPALTEAAIAAVQRWKYKPLSYRGRPMESPATAYVEFRLSSP